MPRLQNGIFRSKTIRFGTDIQIDEQKKKAIDKRRKKKKANKRKRG